ncbi:MAG: cytochrome b561 [Myxococcota bacterium]
MTRKRSPKPRRRRTRITSLHWFNLLLYMIMLVLLLVGIATMGDGTASCFYEVAGPVSSDNQTEHQADNQTDLGLEL